jgi:hypothetical protein
MSTIRYAPLDVPAQGVSPGALKEASARAPSTSAAAVPALLPLYDSRGQAVVASALVDAEDLARLAVYCWRLHGTPTAPRWVARYQARQERDAQAPYM